MFSSTTIRKVDHDADHLYRGRHGDAVEVKPRRHHAEGRIIGRDGYAAMPVERQLRMNANTTRHARMLPQVLVDLQGGADVARLVADDLEPDARRQLCFRRACLLDWADHSTAFAPIWRRISMSTVGTPFKGQPELSLVPSSARQMSRMRTGEPFNARMTRSLKSRIHDAAGAQDHPSGGRDIASGASWFWRSGHLHVADGAALRTGGRRRPRC